MQKTALIGVTGCVAIYKACEVVRGLQKAGVRCKVVMTESATHFVDPLMFRSLTREPVAVGLFDDAPADPIHHISLAKEADIFILAPCTANVMAKMAAGIADDLLTTTALATTAPILIAPAMNVNMYEHAATQSNMRVLESRGVRFVEAEAGYLACGDEGKGRLAEPARIVASALEILGSKRDLQGVNVLITAGPTAEPIDPIRFISNPASGKLGFAIAEAASSRGADVVVVAGPVSLADPVGVEVVRVKTAVQMLDAVSARFEACDLSFFTAAVSDYRPAHPSESKLKKGRDEAALQTIELVENPDILATMGARKRRGQVVVGFAAETEDVERNAAEKMSRKGADLMVANRAGDGMALGADDNAVSILGGTDTIRIGTTPKRELAGIILDEAVKLLPAERALNS